MAATIHALVAGPVDERLRRSLRHDHGIVTVETTDAADAPDCLLDATPLAQGGLASDGSVRPHVALYEAAGAPAEVLSSGADRCVHLSGDAEADAAAVAAVVRSALGRERGTRRDALLREAIDELADVFFLFDTELRFIAWNRRVSEVTKYDDDEIAAMRPADLVAVEDVVAVSAAIQRAIREGRARTEADVVTRDGERIPYEFTGTALTDEEGDVIGICGIGRDVSDRRRRERTRERQAERLRTLNRVNEVIRNVNKDLLRASTREEIVQSVCSRLAAEDSYRFAWLGEYDAARDRVDPVAHAGEGASYLDARRALSFDSDDLTAATAARNGRVEVVQYVADTPGAERWREAALDCGFESAAAIPLRYRDVTYGVLCVYASRPDAFDATERDVLGELGQTIAYAISAVERRRALIADTVVEVEFRVDDESLFPVAASADGPRLELVGAVPNEDGTHVQFLRVEGTPPEEVVDLAIERGVEATVSHADADGGVVRVVVEATVADVLADFGGVVHESRARDGVGRVVALLPTGTNVRQVVTAVQGRFPGTTLVARRERTRDRKPANSLTDELTERQRHVLRTAYLSGFFDTPRANTGAEIAESLDISTATFHEHIRIAERKLVEAALDGAVDRSDVRSA
ncbi:bacterio-opsin activator domain-containing protein [Halomarina halobia]|uniref:Bacterio-opsin activator domain-containing protein n=1 Tax=Halomarina halobia TaxID=3033386 RepID=A0ABD6A8W6_9EURY|nr:bacterio-opsin activator domain-containing protein [Halomarina sp. PSR21]